MIKIPETLAGCNHIKGIIHKRNILRRHCIIDVRTREEYASGHIEGSRNLPFDEIDKVDSVIKDKNAPLYVHCLSGGRSARAAAYLKGKGYREVHDIGGIGSYRGKIVV